MFSRPARFKVPPRLVPASVAPPSRTGTWVAVVGTLLGDGTDVCCVAVTVGEGAAVSADFGTFVAVWVGCIATDVGDSVGKDSGLDRREGANVKVGFGRCLGVGASITSCVAALSTDGVMSCPGVVEHEDEIRPTTKMIRIALGDKKGLLCGGFVPAIPCVIGCQIPSLSPTRLPVGG